MPSRADMKAALQAYVDGFNAGDADAILRLFSPDAVIEDPVGTPPIRGAAIEDLFRRGVAMGTRLYLVAPIRGTHGNAAAMAFRVTTTIEGRPTVIHSLDTMLFDDCGRIIEMKGWWGPDDVEHGP